MHIPVAPNPLPIENPSATTSSAACETSQHPGSTSLIGAQDSVLDGQPAPDRPALRVCACRAR
jgi:hypothetical protein